MKKIRFLGWLLFAFLFLVLPVFAETPPGFVFDFESFTKPVNFSSSVGLLLAITSISLVPFLLISTTSFLRVVIVLSLLRQAIGSQQTPPNPVIVSLALFLTIFIMAPVWTQINTDAVIPYNAGQITQEEAIKEGIKPLRNFMLKATRKKDLALFIEFAKLKAFDRIEDVPTFVVIPAFVISELKTAFQISFLLFIPFLCIDIIVGNILLALGMFMLSPVVISLPFKMLLFVLTDGWNLIIRGLILSFQ
jgi:flagellar biosynthesis protein FliP